jgi:hypothetical protein
LHRQRFARTPRRNGQAQGNQGRAMALRCDPKHGSVDGGPQHTQVALDGI